MNRTQLLRLIPREVQHEQWIDPSCPAATAAHFRLLLDTFNASLVAHVQGAEFSTLEGRVEQDESFYARYAIEGAGMAYALMLHHRIVTVAALEFPYLRHSYAKKLFSLGVGMGVSFLSVQFSECVRYAQALDLRAIKDGYGFYSGIKRRESLLEHGGANLVADDPPDPQLCAGYGRTLWFSRSSSPDDLARIVAALPHDCRASVWRGVGLALAFTGGVEPSTLLRLRSCSNIYDKELTHGVWNGLALRSGCQAPAPYVRWAREVFCRPSVLATPETPATQQAL